MRKLILLLLLPFLYSNAQTITPNRIKVFGATKNNSANRIVVQDSTTKEYHFIQKNTFSIDSNAVHKTGNEDINGVKTFYDDPIIFQGLLDLRHGTIGCFGSAQMEFTSDQFDGFPSFIIGTGAFVSNKTSDISGSFRLDNITVSRVWQMPNLDGTFALVSDIASNNNSRTVTNSTTIVLSSSDLTIAYPSATIGFKVHCLSIIAGGLIYEKTSTGWCQYTATVTP